MKPGRPWNNDPSTVVSPTVPPSSEAVQQQHANNNNNNNNDCVVRYVVGLHRDFLYNDTEHDSAVATLIETIRNNSNDDGGRVVVGVFSDLDYSTESLSRPGCDSESQLRRLRCTCQAAGEAGVPIQIRTLPSAGHADSTHLDSNTYSDVMTDLETAIKETTETFPSIKIHLSCWSGTAEHMHKLLNSYPRNVWVGMDGSVTFSKAKHAHECAFDVPLTRLVLETGTPTTIPAPVASTLGREAFCHSGLIPYIAEAVARYRASSSLDSTAETVARCAASNTIELYPQLAKNSITSATKETS